MKRAPLLFALLLVLLGAGSYGVKLEFFNVEEQSRNFTVTWQSTSELEVREYELQRRTPFSNEAFVKVQTFRAQGPGRLYRFKDDQVYKSASEQVDYRLEAVYENGLREMLVTKSLNYTPTAIRRTWGSIKAMFQ